MANNKGHVDAVGALGSSALRASHDDSLRWGQSRSAGDGQGHQRGCAAPGVAGDPRIRRDSLADTHLRESTAPLLDVPWILDIDTTIKPLYGKQEGAVVSYNPHKPGRPSHGYHTYLIHPHWPLRINSLLRDGSK